MEITKLVEYLSSRKSDVISFKHARVKAQDLGIDLDDPSVLSSLESAGFSFVNGSSELIIRNNNNEEAI